MAGGDIPSRECQDVIEGDLENRFYYFHAIDYDRGGGWNGSAILASMTLSSTIDGRDDCLARGFDRAGFMEIDTQNSKNWQIQLTDPERTGAALAMTRSRRTKIVATLGPASNTVEMVCRLHEAGADMFRIKHEPSSRARTCRAQVEMLREVEVRVKTPVPILVDLQGPKLRVGTFAGDKPRSSRARPSPWTTTRATATRTASTSPIRRSSRRSSPATR